MAALTARSAKKPPKKNKKKNKFGSDDEEDAAAILAALDKAENEENEADNKHKAPAASMFAALQTDDSMPVDEDNVDVTQSTGKKAEKKKNKKKDFEDEFNEVEAIIKNEPETESKDVEPKHVAKIADEGDDQQETRLKSKKEKERERKERQKLAKKQQQHKPVANQQNKEEPTVAVADTSADAPQDDADDADDTKGKKKKKKGSAAKDEPPKRKGAPIAALRELVAARKAAEEEERRLEEEERRRIEEEEKKAEEEERLREEAKRLKKEKERQRIEELKKAGKYLTPAQKAAQARAKAKLDAMLAAGVKVEALASNDADSAQKPKRVVYSNKKKQNKQKQTSQASTPVQEASATASVADEDNVKESWDNDTDNESPAVKAPETPETAEQVKENWDDESDEPEAGDEDVKDNWDSESDQEANNPLQQKQVVEPSKAKKVISPVSVKKTVEAEDAEDEEESDEEEDSDDYEESDDGDDDDDDDSDEDSDDSDGLTVTQRQALQRKEEAAARRKERVEAAMAARSKDDLRSPICCILGHVDTGKTKLLDKIRQTNVQEGEAGGITQQIGATYFPISAIIEKTAMIHKDKEHDYKLPGLLIIDTPGHESFTNLRSRGSSLCNIAILVVDIVHGLEPQTLESLGLLRQRKTPFIVALNKIDRLFDWKANENFPTQDTLALQPKNVLGEFHERVNKVIVEFAEQGLNACLYWDNKNVSKYVSLVPTSAITGEGVPDLLHLLVHLTQTRMTERLMYLSELECTVLEVKVIEGLGTTIDVVLSNGVLNEGDKICVCGLNGPIVTNIRAILTPQPMRELRVKSAYVHHKTVKASLGVKICAPDLEKAIAGSRLMVIGEDDEEDDIRDEVMGDLTSLLSSIDKSGKGVCVQASTLGSLEALLTFLKSSNIPVSGINIGPVHKKDIIRASVMLERAPEYAQLLAFDVPVDRDASDLAEEFGVKIFTANIIYHLFDAFTEYMKNLEEQKRKDAAPIAVFPCLIKIIPGNVFNKKSPIIIGVDVLEGTLKVGTPMCVVAKDTNQVIKIGKVVGIEHNHKPKQEAKRGDAVAVRIESPNYDTPKSFGRHFTEENEIYSHVRQLDIYIYIYIL